MDKPTFVVATNKPWHIDVFKKRCQHLPGQWLLVQTPSALNQILLDSTQPRYIFFPHWSERVPRNILNSAECVCFHETDLPYGRGGSPIQNLIARGHKETVICALRMVEELDAGPIYLKEPLSLEGCADEIFQRSAEVMADMMERIVSTRPQPVSQNGEPLVFKRRTPEQSRITDELLSLESLYDHIRMLDAETYPKAFLEIGDFRFEFTHANIKDQALSARVVIKNKENKA